MQFDVYQNTDKDTNKAYPYFIDIQSNLLDTLNSRVVIPATPVKNAETKYPENLCPVITIQENSFALLTHQITSVPVRLLRQKVSSVVSIRNDIMAAIDFVVTGI